MEKEEIYTCLKCGKEIDWEEYCVCWGWCEECLDADYDEYLKEHPETLSAKEENNRQL